ncbi:cytochrome B [bacterium]|nr:cytochrome B [bacterium]
MTGATRRYTAVAIALHWAIAFSIFGLIGVGWNMGDLPPGDPLRVTLYQMHKSFGIMVLVLSVGRIVWRLMNPPPPEPPMPSWQKRAASAVHIAFYALIIIMPLTGWVLVSAAPQGTPTVLFGVAPWPHLPGLPDLPLETRRDLHGPLEFVHSKLAWVVIVLLGLHVAAALKHQFVDRDGLLSRMAPGVFGRTNGPVEKGRGALIAFAAAAAVLGLGVGAALLTSAPGAAANEAPAPQQAVQTSASPAWKVDPAASRIAFSGIYSGRPFSGVFKDWTADILFDPEAPEDARVRVTVATATADAGDSYFNDSLKDGDWFDVAKHASAVFEVNEGVEKTGANSYEATGVLTIKGEPFPLRLPFTLDITGDKGLMRAEIIMKRLSLGVGKGVTGAPSTSEEWVSDDITVTIEVSATRQPS